MDNFIGSSFEALIRRADKGTLPHALLICGELGLEQLERCKTLARVLLCQNRPQGQSQACGECKSCYLIGSGGHPDYYEVQPEMVAERQSKEIKVDQIRQLSSRLALTSQYQGLKIAIIHPAERLNRNAANSLLKTLEEPSQDSVLILVTSVASRLPPTVRSRCQKLIFSPPSKQEFEAQLAAQFLGENINKLLSTANGSIVTAEEIISGDLLEKRDSSFRLMNELLAEQADVSEVAKQIISMEAIDSFLNWVISWVEDLTKIKMNVALTGLQNQDYQSELTKLSKAAPLDKVVHFYADSLKARQLLLSSANMQLLIESVLLSWTAMFIHKASKR